MQHRNSKLKFVTLLFFITISSLQSHSQNNEDVLLYSKFDSIVGKENLGLNNGPLALNLYKTEGDNTMYLKDDKYTIGTIIYDGEPYYNIKLKYDIFKDQLILNPPGKPEHIGINLIREKTTSFSIYDKNFVLLLKNQTALAEFESGYYELKKINENFLLYIRHHKDIQKRLNDNAVYYSFKGNNTYYIDYKNHFHEINSKSKILKVFPEYKKQINAFYQKNSSLSRTDNDQFINSLMISIYNFSINKSK